MAVTIAACAATCVGDDVTSVGGKYDYPDPANDVSFSQNIGTTEDYDVNANTENACNTPEKDTYVVFFKANGQRAFRIKFTFGCADCSYTPV